MAKYLIIGNGVAAAGCIEGIRSVDGEGDITVVSRENHPVYCRPLISYYLEGKTDLERMKYRADSFYEENGCTVLYGKSAEKIDKESKNVLLDDGTEIEYSRLCVAAGSSPFVPKFEGLSTVKNQFSFMTLDDTLALESAIKKTSRVLIIGAGLIGLKCAEGIKNRVAKITVCDLAGRVLSSILDEDSASIVQKHLETNGIEFLLADSVSKFDKKTALMQSGKKIEFDILVLAVGVRANTALVKDIGGEADRGVVIDDRMQTSVTDVFCAGDCSQGNDISFGGKRVLALLPNAYMQGKCAGINMAGGECKFDKAIPMNSIGFFGLHIMTAGTYCDSSNGGEVYEERGGNMMKKLFTRGGLLTGFILINATDRAGIYTSMIRERVPLDSVNFELLKKSATSAAFAPETRRKMFGSVV